MKPQPEPVKPQEVRGLALKVIAEDKFPVLASIDGDRPRVRPVSPLRNDGFTIWVASMRSSHKTGEIEANPNVELCYMTATHDQVRITGVARTINDLAVKRELWDATPLLAMYLGSVENPQFVLYKVEPTRVRFMREWALDYHEVEIEAPGQR